MVGVRAALETRNKSRDHRLFTDSAFRITEEILQSEYCYSRPSLNTPRTPIQGPRKRVAGVYNGSAVFSDQFRIYPLGLNMAVSWSIGYNWINIVRCSLVFLSLHSFQGLNTDSRGNSLATKRSNSLHRVIQLLSFKTNEHYKKLFQPCTT